MALTTQDGRTVRGFIGATGKPVRQVTGTLSGDRAVQLVPDDDQSETLEGVWPSVLSGDSSRLELVAHGGPADGEHLGFVPMRGKTSGPLPDAVLKMRFFSFSAPFGVQGFSPILFDGSTSRGEQLTYFIEFGYREFSNEPSAVHPIAKAGTYTARLTVVDRFGRWDQEAVSFEVISLVTSGYYVFWEGFTGVPLAGGFPVDFSFDSQNGQDVRGSFTWYTSPQQVADFTGTLSGDRDIRLRFAGSDIVLTGTLYLGGGKQFGHGEWRLSLTQTGGANHGQTYDFHYRNGY